MEINFIVSKKDFETFMMHVILGTTGAAMDNKMNFFFTFWGLELLKKGNKPKVSGVPSIMGGMAAGMFKKKLKTFGYEDIWEMVKDAVDEGNMRLIPCGMSMDLMGIKQEEFHSFVEEPVGAAKFLEMCETGKAVISL